MSGAAGTSRSGGPPPADRAPGGAAVVVRLTTPEETEQLGRGLAGLLRAGDLVVLDGELGAGKTTLTRGLGAGLGVRGAVTSPTFVLARVHPPLGTGPALVHVDAYRLGGLVEVDDLDLDASLEESVTVVEWGEGKVEGLARDRLHVRIARAVLPPGLERDAGYAGPAGEEEVREVTLLGVGTRWASVDLAALRAR